MLWWILTKLLGIILIGLGGFFILLGPGVRTHQPDELAISSIIAGVIMFLAGIYLLLS